MLAILMNEILSFPSLSLYDPRDASADCRSMRGNEKEKEKERRTMK
jgi:hypothetical protein